MGAKTAASVAVVSAAVAGGTVRLLLYPQFVLGVGLVAASVLLKLSRNPMGVALVAIAAVALAVLAALFNEQILRFLRRFVPRFANFAKGQAQKAQDGTLGVLRETPPWVFTLIGFSLPAVAQFLGSMGTVRMLSSVDVKPTSLPGAGFVGVFSVVYLGTLTLGISRTWLKPSKVSFLLQSIWVLGALFSSSASELRFNEHLPSVLAGWGGFLIGLTPGTAIVAALKTAAASAAVAGTGAATIHGVRAGVSYVRASPKDADADVDEDDVSDAGSQGTAATVERAVAATGPSLRDVAASWESWLDEEAWRVWAAQVFSRDVWRERSLKAQSWASSALRTRPRSTTDEDAAVAPTGTAEMTPEQVDAEADEIREELEDSGFEVATLAPPIKFAALVTFFRATPTCLTLLLGVISSLASAARGQFKIGMLAIPVVLAPFALGELVAVAHQMGVRNLLRGGVLSDEYHSELADKYGDGLSLLLWQSPTLLRAWKSMSSWSEKLQNENLFDELADAPRQFFNPDEDVVAATPALSAWIIGQLLLSVVLDIIGASSYAVPALGELSDFAWAPIQGYLVHHMYGVSWLSWVSMLEEILPFTDVLPSASIGFVITYGQYFPVWAKRAWRAVISSLPTVDTGGNTRSGSAWTLESLFQIGDKKRSSSKKRLSAKKRSSGSRTSSDRRRSAAVSATKED